MGKELNAITRQSQLAHLFEQSDVLRLAVYHYKKVVELYDASTADVKKAAHSDYEEALVKLVDLEGALPVAEPKQDYPHGNVILLWLYKYKKNSKLNGYGKIR